MFERILVPLDGTPVAEQALSSAVSVARTRGAELHFATVLMPPLVALPDLPDEESIGKAQVDYLEAVAARARNAGVPRVTVKLLRSDNIVEALEEHRVEVRAGLTVMSSHGRGPAERAWLGSVADRFLRMTEAPVLLLRAARESSGTRDLSVTVRFHRVLVPLDGSGFSRQALDPATELMDTDAEYVLVRIVEPPYAPGAGLLPSGFEFPQQQTEALRAGAQAELDAAAESLRSSGSAVETVTELAAPVAAGILEVAERRGADLIAIATHGRGGFRRAVLGSVADKIVRGAGCPVLTVRPTDASDARHGDPA